MIPRWRSDAYRVKLIFLSLPNAEIAIARVAARVAQGGHKVATAVVRRRFHAGLRNFNQIYKTWLISGSGMIIQAMYRG